MLFSCFDHVLLTSHFDIGLICQDMVPDPIWTWPPLLTPKTSILTILPFSKHPLGSRFPIYDFGTRFRLLDPFLTPPWRLLSQPDTWQYHFSTCSFWTFQNLSKPDFGISSILSLFGAHIFTFWRLLTPRSCLFPSERFLAFWPVFGGAFYDFELPIFDESDLFSWLSWNFDHGHSPFVTHINFGPLTDMTHDPILDFWKSDFWQLLNTSTPYMWIFYMLRFNLLLEPSPVLIKLMTFDPFLTSSSRVFLPKLNFHLLISWILSILDLWIFIFFINYFVKFWSTFCITSPNEFGLVPCQFCSRNFELDFGSISVIEVA